MKIEIQHCVGYSILRMVGDFETYAIGEFLEAMESIKAEHDEEPPRVVLNMRRVKFINSTGIGALLRARKELEAAGGGLALARSSAFVREIFEKLGLDKVLRNYEEEDEAAEALLADKTHEAVPAVPPEEEAALFFRFFDQERANMLGGRGVGAGEIVLLDPSGMTFEWSGRGHRFGDQQMKRMFAEGTELELKFRLPLYKKSTYFVSDARVDGVEVDDGGVRVVTSFVSLDDEASKAVRQYVADMSLVRDEVEQARRNS